MTERRFGSLKSASRVERKADRCQWPATGERDHALLESCTGSSDGDRAEEFVDLRYIGLLA